MKVIISDEAKSRLSNAAANGSIIAKDILAELKKNLDASQILKGNINYFKTKRKRQSDNVAPKIKILFTACTKDITNQHFPDKNNPQAPWFNENRTELDPNTLVSYFKNLPEYSDKDLTYFANAICVDSRLTVKIYEKMSDIYDAYCGNNYVPYIQYGESTLHNSCMRNEETSRNAADFYYHFAGAKLIVVKDDANNIYGRAVLWKNAIYRIQDQDHIISVVDRVYYSHTFIINLIYDFAKSKGINLRKTKNDYNSKTEFTVLNPIEEIGFEADECIELCLSVNVPASKWHKEGAPYMDTFSYLRITSEGTLTLTNRNMNNTIATLTNTNGYASRGKRICPRCGCIYDEYENMCNKCSDEILIATPFGNVIEDKLIKYNEEVYPASLFHRGKPKEHLKLTIQINKIFSED